MSSPTRETNQNNPGLINMGGNGQPSIPTEVGELIFSSLEPVDLYNAGAVCKEWRGCIEGNWRQICVERGFEKEEKQLSWMECARSHSAFYGDFTHGKALDYQPITTTKLFEASHPMSSCLPELFADKKPRSYLDKEGEVTVAAKSYNNQQTLLYFFKRSLRTAH